MADISVLDPRDKRLADPKAVFGFKDADGTPYEKDKLGRPIEHGLGSKGHETSQHYHALIKYNSPPYGDKPEIVAKAQKDLDALLAAREKASEEQF